MTFENDFENSYNIYDLQVGRVSVVGIYRGNRQYEKRMSLQEIFSEENKQKQNNIYEDKEFQLISSTKKTKQEFIKEDNMDKQSEKYQEVIDVIAIIQEISAN